MPTYQYRCAECEGFFEVVQSFSDDALTTCESCGGALRKVFSGVGVVFKGSGFYRTDSRSNSTSSTTGSSGSTTGGSAPASQQPSGSDSSSAASTASTTSGTGSTSGSGSAPSPAS